MASFKDTANPLAKGRTADVYPGGPGTVVKLFHSWVPESDVESERRKATIAHSMGIPTPAVGEIVRRDGRIGLVFERAHGVTMLEKMRSESDAIRTLALQLAELHLDLHQRQAPVELPAQRQLLATKVSRSALLSQEQRDAVLAILARLPDGDRMCHGDFHPGNVMLSDRGPMIIDWVDACRGNPLADVARSSMLFLGHMNHAPAQEKEAVRLFHEVYVDRYFAGAKDERTEYRRWLPVVAAARLAEGIAEQQDWLLDQVRTGIAK